MNRVDAVQVQFGKFSSIRSKTLVDMSQFQGFPSELLLWIVKSQDDLRGK